MSMNDRNRGYNISKRQYQKRGSAVSYVPKARTQQEIMEKFTGGVDIEEKIPIVSRRITREIIISLYKQSMETSLITEWVKTNKEVFSLESISPEFTKDFTLPMSSCLSISRKSSNIYQEESDNLVPYRGISRNYNYTEEYYNDKGIIEGGTKETHEKGANAPLWFNEPLSGGIEDREFSLENFSKRQQLLEEEKRAFLFGSSNADLEDKGGFSRIDELFEEKNKGMVNMKVQDIFTAETELESISAGVNAIDLSTIESNILKSKGDAFDDAIPSTTTGEEYDDGINIDVSGPALAWSSYTAEEIHKHSIENMDNWGLGNLKTIEQPELYVQRTSPIKELFHTAPIEPIPVAERAHKNIFCPDYLHVRELDPVWYYKDSHGVIRGPFTPLEMYNWHIGDYFPPTLEICLGKSAPFITLEAFIATQRREPPMPVLPPAPVYVQQPQYLIRRPNPRQFYIQERPSAPKVEFVEEDFPALESIPISTKPAKNTSQKLATVRKGKKGKEILTKDLLGFL